MEIRLFCCLLGSLGKDLRLPDSMVALASGLWPSLKLWLHSARNAQKGDCDVVYVRLVDTGANEQCHVLIVAVRR